MAPKKVKEKVKAKAKGKAKAKAKEKAVASLSTVASLKEGYDAQANQFGYVNVTDMKAMSKLAEFLALEPDVVSKEMKAIDFDANNLVSFAEFVLWADKHTIGIPLGIDIPDKREWRKGMPAWWTSIPPPTPEEEAALKASTAGVSVAAKKTKKAKKAKKVVPEDPDTSELEDFISAAKEAEWDTLREILGRHPGYVNMRPPYRRYAAIHQACYHGDASIVRELVETWSADALLKTKDGETPEDVAQESGSDEVVTCLQELTVTADDDDESEVEEPPAKMMRGGGADLDPEALMEKASEAIEHAKWQQWDEMFAIFEAYPGCQNMRPEYRRFAAIHQAAYAGDSEILKRMVETGANPGLPTRDKETPLQVAEAEGNTEAVEYLASLEVTSDSAALMQHAHEVIDAAKEGKWDRTFELLAGYSKPEQVVNTRPSVRQYAVLHQAAFHGDIEVLRKLLEDYKANVKLLTKDGKTALQIAETAGQEAAAKYLEACVPSIQLEDDFVKYPEQGFVKVEDKALLKRFQDLLNKSHKSTCNFTRDRNWASGVFENATPVPTGYELVGATRNENAALWRIYQVSKEVTRLDCQKPLKEAPFKKWTPLTMEAGKALDWSDLDFCEEANEWLLFHASIPEALSAIARTGFTMAKLGSGGTTGSGGLYGDGTYFADSITKADEYARRKVEKGEFAGCRAAALCRVLGGRHFYMDKDVNDKDKPKFAKRVLEGHYNSTVGDRLKVKNTFREYVAYDAAATYLEYVIYYRRKGVPAKHE
ncbi:unnamed protein product [Effrenium voratum]|uniref:PARP catalytic domain-containing protein n=1 Tax=Effrenium voratum TaxID=2562239 RepID=A0AA36HVN5_9DINO|nr:unnamed protein product [Effrenium voratum]